MIDNALSPAFDPLWFAGLALYGFLGLLFGSFASAMIHRIPQGLPIFASSARSACTHCGHTLSAKDLIPLLSWLSAKGQCRYCGQKISSLYPVLEMTSALMSVLAFVFYAGFMELEKLLALGAVPFLLALVVIDLRYKILPNILLGVLAVIGLIRIALIHIGNNLADPFLVIDYFIAAAVYAGLAYILGVIMKRVLGKNALGMGDVKFFAVAGLWLGMNALPYFCVISGVLGVALGGVWQKTKGERAFPFGPALIAAFWVLLIF